MSQTAYNEYQPTGFAGSIAKSASLETEAKVNEGAIAMSPGMLVLEGTLEQEVVLPAATFAFPAIAGVVTNEINNPKGLYTNTLSYAQYDNLNIIKEGYVWVTLNGDTIAKGAPLWFVHTTGGASDLHTWRADIDTDKAAKTSLIAQEAGIDGQTIKAKISVQAAIVA